MKISRYFFQSLFFINPKIGQLVCKPSQRGSVSAHGKMVLMGRIVAFQLGLVFCAVLLVNFSALAEVEVKSGVNSAKECAICHFRWMEEFKYESNENLLIQPDDQRHAATELMCFSCHDGSVVDSRFRVWRTTMHKTNEPPPSYMKVPKEFPLDEQGRVQCATCHSAHGVDRGQDMGSAIFLREPNVNSSMCRRCHEDKDNGPKAGNHPVDVSFKNVPEMILQSGGKIGDENKVICETCHTPHGSTNEHFLVVPNSDLSLSQSYLCEACHTVKPKIDSKKEHRLHSHPVDVPLPEDVELPQVWDNGNQPFLGSGDTVVCMTCHAPHKAIEDNHLLVQRDSGDEFCLRCHKTKRSIFGTKHDIAKYYPDESNAAGAKASEKGTCRACHFMHEGRGPKMWARTVDQSGIDALCLSCHRDDQVGKDSQVGVYSHPTDVEFDQTEMLEPLPLLTIRVNERQRVKSVARAAMTFIAGTL